MEDKVPKLETQIVRDPQKMNIQQFFFQFSSSQDPKIHNLNTISFLKEVTLLKRDLKNKTEIFICPIIRDRNKGKRKGFPLEQGVD